MDPALRIDHEASVPQAGAAGRDDDLDVASPIAPFGGKRQRQQRRVEPHMDALRGRLDIGGEVGAGKFEGEVKRRLFAAQQVAVGPDPQRPDLDRQRMVGQVAQR